MISRTSHILRERVGKRMTAFFLSLLIVLFGAGFETVKACCRSFYQNATAHTIMQAYVVETDPLTTSSTDCCGDEGGCCSATDESETEDEGCIPTLIHCSLDDFTPVHHLSAPPILESTSPIFSPHSITHRPIFDGTARLGRHLFTATASFGRTRHAATLLYPYYLIRSLLHSCRQRVRSRHVACPPGDSSRCIPVRKSQ